MQGFVKSGATLSPTVKAEGKMRTEASEGLVRYILAQEREVRVRGERLLWAGGHRHIRPPAPPTIAVAPQHLSPEEPWIS